MRNLIARIDEALLERPAYTMCLAVSCVAFVAAVLGTVVNTFLTGMLGVSGMLAVSLLYLGLAFAHRHEKLPPNCIVEQQADGSSLKTTASQLTTDMEDHDHSVFDEPATADEQVAEMVNA